MAFIDIFNYKKYFKKTSDATVARVGHVNRLAERITAVEYVTQQTSNTTPVTINSYVGQVTMFAALPAAPDAGATGSFRIDNSKVTANSIIIASVEYSSVADRLDLVFSAPLNITDGTFDVAWSTTGATTGALKINFIVL
jgi:hypothetical protein